MIKNALPFAEIINVSIDHYRKTYGQFAIRGGNRKYNSFKQFGQ